MARTQPRTDAEFVAWANNISNQCSANQVEWKLDIKQVTTALCCATGRKKKSK